MKLVVQGKEVVLKGDSKLSKAMVSLKIMRRLVSQEKRVSCGNCVLHSATKFLHSHLILKSKQC